MSFIDQTASALAMPKGALDRPQAMQPAELRPFFSTLELVPFRFMARSFSVTRLVLRAVLTLFCLFSADHVSADERAVTNRRTLTKEEIRRGLLDKAEFQDAVIDGNLLSDALGDLERTKDGGIPELYLKRCTVLYRVTIFGGISGLHLDHVTLNGSLYVEARNVLTSLSCESTTISRNLTLTFGSPKATDPEPTNVQISQSTIGGSVQIVGSVRTAELPSQTRKPARIQLSDVTVGGSFIFNDFNWESVDLKWVDGHIGGDLLFLDNFCRRLLNIRFRTVAVMGRTLFRNNHLGELDFDCPLNRIELTSRLGFWIRQAPSEFNGRARFEKVRIERAHFAGAVFKQEVRFMQSALPELWLDDAVFEKDVIFQVTQLGGPQKQEERKTSLEEQEKDLLPELLRLGPRGGLSAENTRFEGRLQLPWAAVAPNGSLWRVGATSLTGWEAAHDSTREWWNARATPPSLQMWQNLRDTWKASDNTHAANEADYQCQLLESGRKMSWGIWGFGYRPMRAFAWACAVVIACAAAYATQVRSEQPSLSGLRRRFWNALVFSVRTAWQWRFGWANTRGWFWKAFAALEQVTVKVLLLLFAKALANTSPLLKEIAEKLLPFS